MATTVPIPLTTVPSGTTQLGSQSIATGVGTADLVLERHVGANPIDGHPAGQTAITLVIEISFDGGTTFPYKATGAAPGGVITDGGSPPTTLTQSQLGFSLPQASNPNRVARASVVVPGTQVSVSGSMTLT